MKMKKILASFLTAVMVLSMAGCGGTESTEKQPEETKQETTEAKEETTETDEASADLEDTVVVYSTHGEDMLDVHCQSI